MAYGPYMVFLGGPTSTLALYLAALSSAPPGIPSCRALGFPSCDRRRYPPQWRRLAQQLVGLPAKVLDQQPDRIPILAYTKYFGTQLRGIGPASLLLAVGSPALCLAVVFIHLFAGLATTRRVRFECQ